MHPIKNNSTSLSLLCIEMSQTIALNKLTLLCTWLDVSWIKEMTWFVTLWWPSTPCGWILMIAIWWRDLGEVGEWFMFIHHMMAVCTSTWPRHSQSQQRIRSYVRNFTFLRANLLTYDCKAWRGVCSLIQSLVFHSIYFLFKIK